jgi:hypothetical protein
MVFISFDWKLSLTESLDKYESIKKKLVFLCNDRENYLYNNGTRKKCFIDMKGELKTIRIQRLVLDHEFYFDLFPTFLIPNSVLTIYSYCDVTDDVPQFFNRKKKNSFERWLEKEKLDFYLGTGFEKIYQNKEISVYKSSLEVNPYTTRKGKNRILAKEHIFLVRVL